MAPKKRKKAPQTRNKRRPLPRPAPDETKEAAEGNDPVTDEPTASIEGKKVSEEEEKIDKPTIIRKMELLCTYPLKPTEHFAQRSKEIELCRDGSDILRKAFGTVEDIYLPKEITEICISYYEDNLKAMVDRVYEEFGIFADGKVINQLVKQTSRSEREHVSTLLKELSKRGPSYLWWFLLRGRVPMFIPMGESRMAQQGKYFHLFDEDGDKITSMYMSVHAEALYVGVRDNPLHKERGNLLWDQLEDSVPYPDLIGPCLNSSKVTIEQLNSCAESLEARKKKGKDKWLSLLFSLHVAYAAIETWISDESTFEDPEFVHNIEVPQWQCMCQWNTFSDKYSCGEKIFIIKQLENGEVEETYLRFQ